MNNKVAIVTGGSSGIGRLICNRLREHGCVVYAAALDDDLLAEVATDGILPLAVDTTDTQQVNSAVSRVLQEQDRIDILINGASIATPGAVECVPIDDVQRQFDINVFGYGRFMQAVLPAMRRQRSGRIVNISSIAGFLSTPVFGWYSASKFAIEGVSDALRMEVAQFGIDVVLIQPGLIDTPFLAKQAKEMSRIDHPADYDEVVNALERLTRGGMDPDLVAKEVTRTAIMTNPPIRLQLPREPLEYSEIRRTQGDKALDDRLRRDLRL